MKRVVVTGANGFIGRTLCAHLAACGWDVAAVVRSGTALPRLLVALLETGQQADGSVNLPEALRIPFGTGHLA